MPTHCRAIGLKRTLSEKMRDESRYLRAHVYAQVPHEKLPTDTKRESPPPS